MSAGPDRPRADDLDACEATVTVIDRDGRSRVLAVVSDRRPAHLRRIRPMTGAAGEGPVAITYTIH
jgi:hypothetical protein